MTSSSEILVVDSAGSGDFIDIQSASEAAEDNDIIQILPGDYYESIQINVSLTIVGQENVIIYGSNSDTNVITINSNDVIIQDVSIIDSQNGAGIYSKNFINITVENCTFQEINSVFAGINLRNSHNSIIIFNTFDNSGGAKIQFCDNSIIEHCSFNGYYDKLLVTYSNNVVISRNVFQDASYGIYILHGSSNTIEFNTISNLGCRSTARLQ